MRIECDELRLREATHLEAFQRDSDQRVQAAIASYKHLPQEIDSLHVVLDMRMKEMHTLRNKNLELEKQVNIYLLQELYFSGYIKLIPYSFNKYF